MTTHFPAPRTSTVFALAAALFPLACLTPPPRSDMAGGLKDSATGGVAPAHEKMTDLDAWAAVPLMIPGINIGNTLENTTAWETGWGQPPITKEYVQNLARLGFKTVRLPVAWDTYAVEGRIQPDKLARVGEVVQWITEAGMFCVINIHWDGGWIDSDKKEIYPTTFATFSAEAAKKFPSYWEQISTYFAGKNERVIFEALNEETNFTNEGSNEKAYVTLTRVNQLFIDTVRKTGGNNAQRLLIVTGYTTDITKTCAPQYKLPKDTVPGKLFISVHYYTPWQFVGMTEDADWGKVKNTWGEDNEDNDVNELTKLFDMMGAFTTRNNVPAFIGEYNVVSKKDSASRTHWLTAVTNASIARKMVPVLWDTGDHVSRHAPFTMSDELAQTLKDRVSPPATPAPATQ